MKELAASQDFSGEVLEGTPQKINLKSADDVRVEMARVYREMRGRTLNVNEGSKLVYVLSMIGKMVELSAIEKRIEELERGL
ncbi:hypothetical protein [Zhongshania sp.]|uniref:hypothetical protein n=1 Tax=Zhongshania sp. TaxID=1971902 RepID=UPI001B7B87CB|nr:hypothetical protein [Zhongshania sp.]MBQ0795762.1 hypothetical protein [Zhongshania sp.]